MLSLVYADETGNLYDYPGLAMAGRLGDAFVVPEDDEMIPLPSGAGLTMVPGRFPVGVNPATGEFSRLAQNPAGRGRVFAVAALLPQGYTRTLLPAYSRGEENPLPLLGYTAVGFRKGKFYAAAVKTDMPDKWDPRFYHREDLEELVRQRLSQLPGNRIIRQLSVCALDYSCFTAQNIFYRRWEGGIPVSPACNAACLGCISRQPAECCPAPQGRIDFTPAPEEITEIAVPHLQEAAEGIISFGQGCEGEPSLSWRVVSDAVALIRRHTSAGTINMNTNAGYTEAISHLCRSGLDSIRVSLISPNPDLYQAYYRPRGYSLDDVRKSLQTAAEHNVFTSLNLLVFPGVTDREKEVEQLIPFVRETGVKMIQLRNLNIDPDVYQETWPESLQGDSLGIPRLLDVLKAELPGVAIGNFSRPLSSPVR